MTTREQFEKLYPVPEGTSWDGARKEYVPAGFPDTLAGIDQRDNYLEHYAKWQGFQSGHAAGMERAANLPDNENAVNALAWELCLLDGADEDSARTLIWEGNPPEPYGEVWCTYIGSARRLLTIAIEAAAIRAAKEQK